MDDNSSALKNTPYVTVFTHNFVYRNRFNMEDDSRLESCKTRNCCIIGRAAKFPARALRFSYEERVKLTTLRVACCPTPLLLKLTLICVRALCTSSSSTHNRSTLNSIALHLPMLQFQSERIRLNAFLCLLAFDANLCHCSAIRKSTLSSQA